jgi:squalene synthase HpnC
MTADTIDQLAIFGPDRCDTLSVEQARAWCRRLALRHYENFSVLSTLVPPRLRDDFAALYAFCRWADDLGDETGDRARSSELLAWWRRELEQCLAGEPRHPVFIALAPTIARHDLPHTLFDDLIRAFEQDQLVTRYPTWDDLLDYCRRSANPVGRLVLMISGQPRTGELFALSDDVCTALQLTNHWQDVRRDILDRDRVYVPRELVPPEVGDFESRLRASARQEFGVDRAFLEQSRRIVRECLERTWPHFERGLALPGKVSRDIRPVIRLFIAGGMHVLRAIEAWNYETALHRPRLSRPARLWLVARAWIGARLQGSKP